MYQLFTDSDTDMTPELCKEYGYKMISMPYTVDGQLVRPYEDFDVFDSKAYYDSLRAGKLPTTSAISAQNYIDYFEPSFKEGKDILYVHFSAAMTNTFDFMNQAVQELLKKYPERKFYEVDTMGITIVSQLIALEIGDLAKEGKSAEEIVEWGKREVLKRAIYFYADDLKFFHKSGRVSGLTAVMGTLIGIRPIIYMSDEGKMVSVGKAKGHRKAVERLVQYVEELGDDVKNHRIIVGHTDSPEGAQEVVDLLKEKFGQDLNIMITVVNPTTGCHCGPNGVGVTFHAIHR